MHFSCFPHHKDTREHGSKCRLTSSFRKLLHQFETFGRTSCVSINTSRKKFNSRNYSWQLRGTSDILPLMTRTGAMKTLNGHTVQSRISNVSAVGHIQSYQLTTSLLNLKISSILEHDYSRCIFIYLMTFSNSLN